MSFRMSVVLSFGLLLLVAGFGVPAAPQGTAFTYQGELKQAGQPANGLFDFEVGLYLQGAGGAPVAVLQIASPRCHSRVTRPGSGLGFALVQALVVSPDCFRARR